MRKDYNSVCEEFEELLKDYLLMWVKDTQMINDIVFMLDTKSMIEYVKRNVNIIYPLAIHHLYQSKDYLSLQRGLIVMNGLFDCNDYRRVKEDLYKKLVSRPISVDTYLVLRHLKELKSIPDFLYFINKELSISLEEYAKICIIENEYDEAFRVLKQLDVCDNSLLDAIAANSLIKYYHLKKQRSMNHHLQLEFVH